MHLEPLIPPSVPLAALAIATDLAALAAGIAVVRGQQGALRQCWLMVIVLAAAALIGGAAAKLLLGSLFATLRVWTHLLWFAAVPLALLVGLRGLARREFAGGALALTAGLGLFGALWWSHYVEPWAIEVTHRSFASARLAPGARYRIAILADIQTDAVGSYEAEVIARTAAEKPDLVLLPGDFVQFRDRQRFRPERDRLVALLETLDPPLGIWAVMGDVDFHPDIFAGTKIRMLDDTVAPIPGAPDLQLAGLSLGASRHPPSAAVDAALAAFRGLTIVVGHAPDGALPWIRGERRDPVLYVAGHTHGGQVVIPGFGPPLTLSAVPREVAAGGLFAFGEAAVVVSRGVGHERGWAPRLRFACPPELAIVELRGPPPER